jgi:vacuolar-type H+-ATPase subunit E/Vma4
MSDEEHRAVMESWMRELPADTAGQVVCNERDRARLEPLVAKLNAGRPLEARLELSQQSAPLLGGVLFKTEKFEIDLSLDARLRQLREELVPEVSRIVFPADVTV